MNTLKNILQFHVYEKLSWTISICTDAKHPYLCTKPCLEISYTLDRVASDYRSFTYNTEGRAAARNWLDSLKYTILTEKQYDLMYNSIATMMERIDA